MTTRIDQRFAQLKAEGRAGLVTFVMAGDPDLETSLQVLKTLPPPTPTAQKILIIVRKSQRYRIASISSMVRRFAPMRLSNISRLAVS